LRNWDQCCWGEGYLVDPYGGIYREPFFGEGFEFDGTGLMSEGIREKIPLVQG
jgi:hypothetical protein